jgi:hypothetical protein
MYGEMVIVWIIAALLFVGLHYFPWEQIFGEVRKPPETYICGTLGLGACYSGLLGWWAFYREASFILALIAFWGVVTFGGGAVWACYVLDARLEKRASAQDEQTRAELSARRQDEKK